MFLKIFGLLLADLVLPYLGTLVSPDFIHIVNAFLPTDLHKRLWVGFVQS